MQIKVRNNNVDAALRIFKRKGREIVMELREREFYEKPSITKTKRKKYAKNKERKRMKNDSLKGDNKYGRN